MSIVKTENIFKSYMVGNNEISILKDINIDINKGEFVSIMGPSGVGKSTLLYLLGGLDTPTSGVVNVAGHDLYKISEKKLSKLRRTKIGFVFQFYNLVGNLSVEENVMLPLMLDNRNLKDYKDKVDEIIELIGMTSKRKLTPRELSGGQQQRVAIARALVYEPEVLFLDEPIGNLDSKNGTEAMELFRKINTELGKTIIQVTHSEDAATYGNIIYKMLDGRINEIVKL